MFLVKSPFFLKWYYPNLLWNKTRHEKTIYLTFDDGPIPIVTEFVLKTLAGYNAKATFFCIGDNIVKHPDIFSKVTSAGHSIGNHTFNHLNGWKTNDETYIENVLKAQALTQTNLFRPPYGRIKKSQIRRFKAEGGEAESGRKQKPISKQQGVPSNLSHQAVEMTPQPYPQTQPSTLNPLALHLIMWDVLSGDFDTSLSPKKCYQNVINNTRNGSIIVFHDSLKAFDRLQYALPRVLKYFAERGFGFEKL